MQNISNDVYLKIEELLEKDVELSQFWKVHYTLKQLNLTTKLIKLSLVKLYNTLPAVGSNFGGKFNALFAYKKVIARKPVDSFRMVVVLLKLNGMSDIKHGLFEHPDMGVHGLSYLFPPTVFELQL